MCRNSEEMRDGGPITVAAQRKLIRNQVVERQAERYAKTDADNDGQGRKLAAVGMRRGAMVRSIIAIGLF